MKKLLFLFLIVSTFHSVAQKVLDGPLYGEGRREEYDPIDVKEYTLKNGFKVFLSENHDKPQVFGAVIVKAGGKNDPADATGMAHYLEHMLFKGTTSLGTTGFEKEKVFLNQVDSLYEVLGKTTDKEKRKEIQKKINEVSVKAAEFAIPNEMDRMLTEIGSEDVNAFTTEDLTAYINSFPSNEIEKWIEIYAHRFQNPVFRLFQAELETVYEEKNISMDSPLDYVLEQYMKRFYKVHPYGQQTVIGKTEHLKNPSLKKMYEYFNTYYVANNMALVLSGDFKAEEIFPLIEKKFGVWRTGKIPEFPEYKESEFKGREFFKLRATPVKAGAIGYRIPANGKEDNEVIEVISTMLSNSERSGYLDRLNTEGKLMMAGFFPYPSNDYGAAVLYFIPKIVGQSLKKAEKIVLAELDKLKKGEFTNEQLEAVKLSLIKNFQQQWESNESRALAIGQCYVEGTPWKKYLQYEEKIRKITKEEVVNAANKYFGENNLTMYSKMGFPKKDKLEKPGFEPVVPKEEKHSSFYEEWKKTPSKHPEPKYVDMENDIQVIQLADKVTLKRSLNHYNKIFTLKIRYGTGKYYLPLLKYVPSYLEIADQQNLTSTGFKQKLAELGCTIGFSVGERETAIHLQGMDEQLGEVLKLTNTFLHQLKADETKIKKVAHDLEASQKISRRSPSYWSQLVNAWALYGKESPFLREISLNEFKKLSARNIINAMDSARKYEVTINYAGTLQEAELRKAFSYYDFGTSLQPKMSPVYFEKQVAKENTIYFYNDKKAVQSQIYFFINGRNFDVKDVGVINAFNKYFGGDMSSLVFQEIREFRSLAYSTWAWYNTPFIPGKKCYFNAYVGCQGDKTIDAMKAMNELIHNMPEKAERWEGIRSSLLESAQSERPGFRNIIETIESWQMQSYTDDPNKLLVEEYQRLNFGNLVEFYKTEIKNRPMTITVVGNAKRINMNELKKFGKVIVVKESQILKK
ncbi:MAG: M16 family metallopeptidase [Bacteroidota bacterium]